jgi:hypothetical protein
VSAQAAIDYFDETKVVTSYGVTSATCPSGWKVVGGGFERRGDYVSPSSTGTSYYYKPRSSGPSAQSWRVTVTKITESYSSYYHEWRTSYSTTSPAKVYATCVR